jgi:hypothetical protein
MLRFTFTRVSKNKKTGPIPTVIVSRNTCPPSCPMYTGGCYAMSGPVRMHWDRTNNSGVTLDQLLENVRNLPHGQVWRYGVSGDLPGVEEKISPFMLRRLIEANRGRKGFAYTHKNPHNDNNARQIRYANQNGFTVNLSSNNIAQVDEYMALGIGPVVTIVPDDFSQERASAGLTESGRERKVALWRHTHTPGGTMVVQCPAEYRDEVSCSNCGGAGGPLCSRADRKFAVGFTVHGTGRNKANQAAKGLPVIQ